MVRTFKYELRPTDEQAQALDFLLWQARKVYNAALAQRIRMYQENGQGIQYAGQWAHFRDERRAQPDTLGKLNASSLQQMLRRLDKAFGAFFRRVKAGETPGFPRFKGRHRFKSLEYTYGDGCKLRVSADGRASFYVQSVGEMRLAYHRPWSAPHERMLLANSDDPCGGAYYGRVTQGDERTTRMFSQAPTGGHRHVPQAPTLRSDPR